MDSCVEEQNTRLERGDDDVVRSGALQAGGGGGRARPWATWTLPTSTSWEGKNRATNGADQGGLVL